MKVKIEGFVTWREDWNGVGYFQICRSNMGDVEGYINVCEASVEVEVPDNFDPRAAQVEALKRQKQAVMADFQKRVTDIERQIAQLTALEAA